MHSMPHLLFSTDSHFYKIAFNRRWLRYCSAPIFREEVTHMARTTFHQWAKNLIHSSRSIRKKRKVNQARRFEHLDDRTMLTVSAVFAAGQLSVFGDAQ